MCTDTINVMCTDTITRMKTHTHAQADAHMIMILFIALLSRVVDDRIQVI